MRNWECGIRNESELGRGNGECGSRNAEWGKLKKQLCVRLEVGGLKQKAKSPSSLINLINPINSINYLRLEPIFFSIQHRASSIQHRVSSIEHRVSSIEHRVSSIEHRVSSIESAHPANAAGFHLTDGRCQLLLGALIFALEKRFFNTVIDEIPGQFFIQITFAEDIKIRVYGHCFKGLGPVNLSADWRLFSVHFLFF